ncbi:MAG: thioesterase family protein [Micrococcaceae bacterium]
MTNSYPKNAIIVPLQMRWSDMDAYEHGNNGIYLTYLEEARFRWRDGQYEGATGSYIKDLLPDDVVNLVASHRIEYVSQLQYAKTDGNIYVRLWVCKIGTSSFTSAGIITDKSGEQVYVKSLSTLVQYNQNTQKSEPLSDEVKSYLESMHGPEPEFHG